jgi:hypothetical protein
MHHASCLDGNLAAVSQDHIGVGPPVSFDEFVWVLPIMPCGLLVVFFPGYKAKLEVTSRLLIDFTGFSYVLRCRVPRFQFFV